MADNADDEPPPPPPVPEGTIKVHWYSIIIDFVCLNLVGWPIFFMQWFAKPYKRGFFCHDLNVKYAFVAERLPFDFLYIIGLGINLAFILVTEIILRKKEKRKVHFLRLHPPPWMYFTLYRVLLFLFGAGCTQLITTFLKYRVGRYTPYFYTVCSPKTIPDLPCDINQRTFFTEFSCTNHNFTRNKRVLRDMRLSFPSLHASYSMYAMLYLAFYLQQRFTWEGSRLLRPSLQFLGFAGSLFISLTRISDYKSHTTDILGGLIIGSVMACLTVAVFGRDPAAEPELSSSKSSSDLSKSASSTRATGSKKRRSN